jgi:hypothetical protein
MTKAINWPSQFRDEVLAEDTVKRCAAFRLGRLYYDNHYWVDGEMVDIRVNHQIVRQAVIIDELKCCPIQDLSVDDYAAQKPGLQTAADVVVYLSETYQQPVTFSTEVTVVYYTNLPLNPAQMEMPDDPHM